MVRERSEERRRSRSKDRRSRSKERRRSRSKERRRSRSKDRRRSRSKERSRRSRSRSRDEKKERKRERSRYGEECFDLLLIENFRSPKSKKERGPLGAEEVSRKQKTVLGTTPNVVHTLIAVFLAPSYF